MGTISEELRGTVDDPSDNLQAGGCDVLVVPLRAHQLQIRHSGEGNTERCRGNRQHMPPLGVRTQTHGRDTRRAHTGTGYCTTASYPSACDFTAAHGDSGPGGSIQ